jgi:hypothetical protein
MARAENQGLQIALIVFVMLTIVLAVVTFLYVRNYQEAMAQNATLDKSAAENKKLADAAQKDFNTVKEHLGVDVSMAAEKVKAMFDEDMKQFAATLPPDKQHYRDALESLWNTNQELFAASTDLQNNFKQLQDQLTRREEERDRQIKEFRDKTEAQAKDTLDQRGIFDADRQKVNDDKVALLQSVEKKESEKAAIADQAAKQEQTLRTENKTLGTTNKIMGDKIRGYQKSQFEVAQGHIRGVNSDTTTKMVYIDLGRADHLIPLVTFSVHDSEANTAQGDGLKARIEVTQILDDHLSVARILDEDFANPIANDDKIYTPLWQPGQRMHYAILGTIDLDGDGADDRPVVRDMITSVGGVIDAEMDVQGKITGDVDTNTRYLLEGKIPKDRNAAEGAAKLISDAESAGAERMSLAKFVEQSGWKDPRQTVLFGRKGTRERIPPEPRDGTTRTGLSSTEGNFQKRRPWRPPAPATKEAE